MPENPYDEKHVRVEGFVVHARIEPKHDDPSLRTLTLAVSDGPETYTYFDPEAPLDEFGESPLTRAIQDGVNGQIQAALECEAGRWIEDHETCYLVQGQTGKAASDPARLDRWTVKAFLSEDRAHDLLHKLNHWCLTHGLSRLAYEDPMQRHIIDPEGKVAKCPHDPGFRIDQTGVIYTIVEVPLDMFDPIGGV